MHLLEGKTSLCPWINEPATLYSGNLRLAINGLRKKGLEKFLASCTPLRF
jgi:hypothetical protein